MKKIHVFLLAFLVLFSTGAGQLLAQIQIDRGQQRGQVDSVSKYFVARNGRITTISADRVVVWDTTSNDGITVTTSTTSYDALVAGVTIDEIPGITSDATAALSPGGSNWGRVRVYGRHADVSYDGFTTGIVAGMRAAQGNIAGTSTVFTTVSEDEADSMFSSSRDSFGTFLETPSANDKTIDIFVTRG